MAMDANRYLAGAPTGFCIPHVILPAQHFGRPRPTPEHRLRIAVIDHAVRCVDKYRLATGVRGRRLFDEARQWLLAGETDWPYSFEGLCAVLDLDANALRERLRLVPEPLVPASRESQDLVR
jgi:hypothetical protein